MNFLKSYLPKMCLKLVLPFLDNRNSLQGTTLFGAIWPLAESPGSFIFKLRRKIFSNCIFISNNSDDASGELHYQAGALYIRETSPEFPQLRKRFDEERLLADFEYLSNSEFKIPVRDNNLLSVAVAGFKHFLLCNVPKPKKDEHWAFVGLRTQNWPESYSGTLAVDQIYSNSGRARCVLNLQDADKAELYFSLAPRKLPGHDNM